MIKFEEPASNPRLAYMKFMNGLTDRQIAYVKRNAKRCEISRADVCREGVPLDEDINIRCLKLPPELGDGMYDSTLPLTDTSILPLLISEWAEEASQEETIEIGVVILTQEELDNLGEI